MRADGDLECGKCKSWVGESAVALVKVETVKSGHDVTIGRPRDLRLCRRCGKVTVFVPRSDLDLRRSRAVASL